MRNNKSGSTTIVQVVCAIIFVIFSIYYIYSFQGDIFGMIQYAWSDHETHYNRLIGGSIILAILYLITYLVGLFLSFPARLKSLQYMPAMLIMAQTTAVQVDDKGFVTMPWYPAWITVVLLILYPFVVRGLKNTNASSILPIDAERALLWLTNGLVMLFLIIMTYSIGNTDRILHTRLAVERLCHEGKFDEALSEGIPQYDHGSGITMYRAFALSKSMLGDKLFTYNIDGNVKTILPRKGTEPHALLYDCYPIWQSLGFVPRNVNEDAVIYIKREIRRHTARPAAKDYLLCTLLLRKDIDTFVKELPKYYNVKESLPQHYKEALTMYYTDPLRQSKIAKDSVVLDNAMIEDYNDFQNILHVKGNSTVKDAKLRDNYFGTYWYYYYRKD